ncbi:hypothetical protein [Nocardioides zeae]|uniref:DUF4386 domain-containing protein n=1 Tax=Nocardioides zeae TaxID=1457234 RepID=A0A6P0HQC5_9ACTN|nr:hypothetical protein [Nocardioides zeae]NEN80460.1 hypothetical protein [Nocardioides zeae]
MTATTSERATAAAELRILAICGWCGPATVAVAFAGWLVAGVLPFPLRASSTTAEVVRFYAGGVHVPLGIALASVGVSLVIPLVAAMSHLVRRVDDRPLLAQVQLVAGATTAALLVVPMLVMATAGFRPDRPADLTVLLNDLAWLLFLTPVAPFVIQNLVLATAVLTHPSSVFPRWVGYLNLWVGFTFTFDVLAYAFHTGPFAWHGLLIFWLALTSYAVWLVVMGWHVRRAAVTLLHESEEDR